MPRAPAAIADPTTTSISKDVFFRQCEVVAIIGGLIFSTVGAVITNVNHDEMLAADERFATIPCDLSPLCVNATASSEALFGVYGQAIQGKRFFGFPTTTQGYDLVMEPIPVTALVYQSALISVGLTALSLVISVLLMVFTHESVFDGNPTDLLVWWRYAQSYVMLSVITLAGGATFGMRAIIYLTAIKFPNLHAIADDVAAPDSILSVISSVIIFINTSMMVLTLGMSQLVFSTALASRMSFVLDADGKVHKDGLAAAADDPPAAPKAPAAAEDASVRPDRREAVWARGITQAESSITGQGSNHEARKESLRRRKDSRTGGSQRKLMVVDTGKGEKRLFRMETHSKRMVEVKRSLSHKQVQPSAQSEIVTRTSEAQGRKPAFSLSTRLFLGAVRGLAKGANKKLDQAGGDTDADGDGDGGRYESPPARSSKSNHELIQPDSAPQAVRASTLATRKLHHSSAGGAGAFRSIEEDHPIDGDDPVGGDPGGGEPPERALRPGGGPDEIVQLVSGPGTSRNVSKSASRMSRNDLVGVPE